MKRENYIASVMQISFSKNGKMPNFEQLKHKVNIMDEIPVVTPEEYYSAQNKNKKDSFDSLSYNQRKIIIQEVTLYLMAKDLYCKIKQIEGGNA